MRAKEFVTEIERIDARAFSGGKKELELEKVKSKQVRKLPGNNNFLYSVSQSSGYSSIKIWDPDNKPQKPKFDDDDYYEVYADRMKQFEKLKKSVPGALIGQLNIYHNDDIFPIPNSASVGTITVDEDYRGMGIGTALYGIVLTIMKRPLIAGSQQTPGGRKNWLRLANIPGVEIKGFVYVEDRDLEIRKLAYSGKTNKKYVKKRIDDLMQLGGQYIGKGNKGTYWAFDVVPSTGELAPAVKNYMSKLYQNEYSGGPRTGLYAIYTGQ